jgi:hypothetical protein
MRELDYLTNEYVERIQLLTDALTQGNLPSIEEYRYVCGQLRGLEAACGVIRDLKKRLENSDNE